MKKLQEKFIHVGNYVARIELEYLFNDDSWSPCISVKDARKLDEIKAALEKGDLKAAGLNAKIYTLTPVTKAA